MTENKLHEVTGGYNRLLEVAKRQLARAVFIVTSCNIL
jgi:hypothetical protein